MKNKIDIKNILFWVFLIIAIILLIWRIFGDSPSDLAIIATFISMLMFKIWSVSDRQIKSEIKFNNLGKGFVRLARDFKEYKNKDLENLKNQ